MVGGTGIEVDSGRNVKQLKLRAIRHNLPDSFEIPVSAEVPPCASECTGFVAEVATQVATAAGEFMTVSYAARSWFSRR
jgi:hypothetical protein